MVREVGCAMMRLRVKVIVATTLVGLRESKVEEEEEGERESESF